MGVAWTSKPLLELSLKLHLSMMDFLVVSMKPSRLWTKDKLCCVFWQKTVTKLHTKKLVQALCQEHQIPLLTVPDNMQLGKYAGLCKLDAEGNERKVLQRAPCRPRGAARPPD